MGAADHSTRRIAACRRWAVAVSVALVAALCAACSSGPPAPRSLSDPSQSVVPVPNYTDDCAPLGADTSVTCLRVTLDAIDTARAQEGVGPMDLPANFAQLSIPEQLFVALNAERVDRGLSPLCRTLRLARSRRPAGGRCGHAARPARPRVLRGEPGVDGCRRQRTRRRLPMVVLRRTRQWRAAMFESADLGLLGGSPDRAEPLRIRSPRHGSRLQPRRRHQSRRSGWVIAGRNDGPHGVGHHGHLRVHLETGARIHRHRDASAAARHPRFGVGHRYLRSVHQRRTSSRLHRGSARPMGWTRRPGASAPFWRRSTGPMRSRASGPWCCRPTTGT